MSNIVAASPAAGIVQAPARTPAPWKPVVEKALAKNRQLANSRYVQLATVRPDGRPACRTVVFRGFLQGSDSFTFITDKRSEKVADVAHSSAAEVCWYLPQTREQFRMSGLLTIVDEAGQGSAMQEARQAAWTKLSDPARVQFAWPHPGQPRELTGEQYEQIAAPGPNEPPTEHFCLVVLDVQHVDHLSLKRNTRVVYTRSEDTDGAVLWQAQDVNP